MWIHGIPCKYKKQYMKIREKQWASMNTHKNLWTSMKSMNMYEIYLFWKKKIGNILYPKKINASHVCPLKKNRLLRPRKWKSGFSWKHWLWPAKHWSKSCFWWKPKMIPRSLRSFCPSRFDWKPREKSSFWQKCRFPFFQKSRADLLGQYPAVWHGLCANFDDFYMRTGLEWSQGFGN